MHTKGKTIIHRGGHRRISIVLGVPSFASVPIEWAVSALRLQPPVNCRLESIVTINEEVGAARDIIARSALGISPRPEYLFFFGVDMIPRWDALVILWEEMRRNPWDVLGALYFAKGEPPKPILWREEIDGALIEGVHYRAGEVVPSDISGMDFTLIRTELFDRLTPPYFRTGPEETPRGVWVYTEDAYFCRAVKDAGGEIGIHTGVRVGHLDTETGTIY